MYFREFFLQGFVYNLRLSFGSVVRMNPTPSDGLTSMVYVILISLTIGIAIGIGIVILIQVQRRAEEINSMGSLENAVGLWATVEVPFDRQSRGKVRVVIRGSTMDLAAITDAEAPLHPGDRVFVIAAQSNRVLVIPESQMQQS